MNKKTRNHFDSGIKIEPCVHFTGRKNTTQSLHFQGRRQGAGHKERSSEVRLQTMVCIAVEGFPLL